MQPRPVPDRVHKAADACVPLLQTVFAGPIDTVNFTRYKLGVTAFSKQFGPDHVLLHALDHEGDGPSCWSIF